MMGDEVGRKTTLTLDDITVAAGIILLTIGSFLAWPPLAFIVLGGALIAIVRYGTPEE